VLLALTLSLLLLGCGTSRTDFSDPGEIAQEAAEEQRLADLKRRVTRLDRTRHERRRSPGEIAGFNAFARRLDGEVGVVVGGSRGGRSLSAGKLTTGTAWSTIKVPIALRVIQDVGGVGRLTAAQRTQIARAITASDNDAVAQLFDDLASRHGGIQGAARAVTEVLRAAGDRRTTVSTQGRDGFSAYGQTQWSLRAQERFMAALAGGSMAESPSTRYVLALMGRVTSDRWGLGSTGVPARWKGGWGPETDGRYLVRQMGVLNARGKRLIVPIAARLSDGLFASGQRLAPRVAKWLARRADRLGTSRAGLGTPRRYGSSASRGRAALSRQVAQPFGCA